MSNESEKKAVEVAREIAAVAMHDLVRADGRLPQITEIIQTALDEARREQKAADEKVYTQADMDKEVAGFNSVCEALKQVNSEYMALKQSDREGLDIALTNQRRQLSGIHDLTISELERARRGAREVIDSLESQLAEKDARIAELERRLPLARREGIEEAIEIVKRNRLLGESGLRTSLVAALELATQQQSKQKGER